MKISIHYSGILWDFFEENHPEFLEGLKELVKKGQLEMMTGGYYEPILAVIPDEDKVGQIKRLTQTIQEEDGSHSERDVAGRKSLGTSSSKVFGGSRGRIYHDR